MTRQVKWVLTIAVSLSVLFCGSFVYFYTQRQKELRKPVESQAIDKPLPEARLVDESDRVLDDKMLRLGKVVLVFVNPECQPCKTEGRFLETILDRRKDVRFFGVVSFGEKKAALDAARSVFPFRVFYDDGFRLAAKFGITRVPIKLYIENGIIKKAWGGASVAEETRKAFVAWLDELK